MTIEEFLTAIENIRPPATHQDMVALERALGGALPSDYKDFLVRCNGGYVGGALWYTGLTPSGHVADAGVHHIGGFRQEPHLSLEWHRECYTGRIPDDLLWIMDDPFGNAICLGVRGAHRGRVYFWDHENEPDPDDWNGQVDTAANVELIANSFTQFVAGLAPTDDGTELPQ